MNFSSVPNAKVMSAFRIVFGFIWLFDAWCKWQPGFINSMATDVSRHMKGQFILAWFWMNLWVNVVKINPHAFAYLVALGETAIAIGLILGLFSNLTNIVGILLSLGIWTTAEGFGGPYAPGKTDIGTSIIYTLVFVALIFTQSSRFYSLDNRLRNKLGRFNFLIAHSDEAEETEAEETEQPQPVHA